jgi:WD40 repeat protein
VRRLGAFALVGLLALTASCNRIKDKLGITEEVSPPPAPSGPVDCATFHPAEGRFKATGKKGPKPAKGVVVVEPSFHTCLVRVTDHDKEKLEGFSRTDYSRREAFNADGTLFFTNSRDGGWHLYDAKTFAYEKPLPALKGDAEPQWDPKDPNIMLYGERNGGLVIRALDVSKGTSTVAIDLTGKLPWPGAARAWTRSEGSPSKDGRYWGFQVETGNFDILGYAVWDRVESKLVGTMPSKVRPDHVSMSPSGRWLVVSGGDGTVAWSSDFKEHKLLHKRTEHSDLAIGPEGHDYYVSIDYDDSGWIFFTDIDTGERTNAIRTYVNHSATAMHFSGKAFEKPGWVLVSTYKESGPPQWFMGKVFAMELAKGGRVYQLASHNDVRNEEYFAEPHASVNRDFTRVIFNSNWGGNELDIDAYMLELPKNAFP